MIGLRDIKELIVQYGDIWFWIEEAYYNDFYNDLIRLNAVFMDGKPITTDSIRRCMGVNQDMVVRYVTFLVWCKSSSGSPIKIDYRKYIEGQEDYIL